MKFIRRFQLHTDRMGLRQVRRLVVFMVGITIVLIGVVMLVTPGPAVVVIPAGLAILGLEFRWARRWLRQARAMVTKSVQRRPEPGRNPEHTPTKEQTQSRSPVKCT
jgi:uncharacterized protein (TIGR02611 family)